MAKVEQFSSYFVELQLEKPLTIVIHTVKSSGVCKSICGDCRCYMRYQRLVEVDVVLHAAVLGRGLRYSTGVRLVATHLCA